MAEDPPGRPWRRRLRRARLGSMRHLDPVPGWVARRRACSDDPTLPRGSGEVWGLALSGGGVRSATFCFGLLRALARHGALARFDLLSTVSGGGYIGATLGRLFDQAGSPDEVAAVHAALKDGDDQRWFAWWLRANGRYLMPRGFKDTVFALAVYLQSLVGVHIELGVLALLLGACLAAGNSVVWLGMPPDLLSALPPGFRWLPTLWLVGLPPLMVRAAALMRSYWSLPDKAQSCLTRPDVALATSVLLLAVLAWLKPSLVRLDIQAVAWFAALLLALAWGLAVPGVRRAQAKARRHLADAGVAEPAPRLVRDEARHLLVRALGRTGRWMLAVLALGALDRLAWWFAFEMQAMEWLAAVLLTSTALLRAVLPRLVPVSGTQHPLVGATLGSLGNLAGYLLLAGVLLLWLTGFYKLLFIDSSEVAPAQWPALPMALAVLVATAGYAWLSRREFGFLNLSSLHNFYRARITRSYLGAVNGRRFGLPGAGLDALQPVPPEPIGGHRLVEVTDVHAADDCGMTEYAPHRFGGPVHLINVCINETNDRRGGLFNQDRRGLSMVVGPKAWLRVGAQPWRQARRGEGAMTLGHWIAISGAAFAPGLGQLTRGGVAALTTLTGLRLGYWWDSHCLGRRGAPVAHANSKTQGLLSELTGRFDVREGASWYLSDGGHYENTGALTLLAQQARVVLLADCGADPRYGFGDLENLVRKARIDLQAEIEFLRPHADQPDAALGDFGSLDDLASPDSVACLALARIRYADGTTGHLVLVKPNMPAGMTADLVNFKRDNPSFPQETTTDQFFGEAQWESYFKLGRLLGRGLTRDLLEHLPRHALRFEDDHGPRAQQARGEAGAATADGGGRRLPRRIVGTAVAASVGLGTAITLGVPAWQAWDSMRASQAAARTAQGAALQQLADRYGAWTRGDAKTLGALAGTVLHLADKPCDAGDNAWFRDSPLARCVLRNVREACAEPVGEGLPACRMLLESTGVRCLAPAPVQRTANYWFHGFADPDQARLSSCPPLPVAAAVAPAPVAPASSAAPAASAAPSASAASGAPAATADAAPPAAAPAAQACAGRTVYVQIYGGAQREAVRAYRERWRQLGASVPPIEDVLDTARRANRAAPRVTAGVSRTLYHDAASHDCAAAVVAAAKAQPGIEGTWSDPVPLPARLTAQPGVIEVWVAPPLK